MKKIWVVALFAGAFGVSCTEFAVVGLLPQIAGDMGVSESAAGQLVTLNAIAFAIGAPVLSALCSRMDRRKLLLGALLVFAAGNAMAGLAPNFGVLLASRLLSGAMMGIYLATAIGVAAKLADPPKRATTMATIVAGVSTATALGVPVSTLMGQNLNWRVPMFGIGALALLAMALIAVVIPASGADDGPPLRERLTALRTKPVIIGLCAIVLFWGASFTVYTYLVPLLETRAGVHGTLVTVVLFIAGLAAVAGNIIGGRGADSRPRATLLITAGITALSLLVVLPLATSAAGAIVLVGIWQLAAWSFVPAVQANLYQAAGPGGDLAVSFAVSGFNVGIVAGAGLGGVALDVGGLPAVSWLGAALGVVALGLVFALISRQRPVTKEESSSDELEREYSAILFDMDGTLLDSTDAVRRAWLKWAEEEGVDPGKLAGTTGKPAKQIVGDLVPEERAEAALARYTHIATHELDGVVVLPGAVEALRSSGVHKAVVTSSSRDVTTARMAAAGLPEPEVVVTADDCGRGKPDPAPYLLAAERLGVPAEQCLVIEDTANGIASGRAAGCATLGIADPGDGDELGAHSHVPDLGRVRFEPAGGGVALRLADVVKA
jgi:HAD superfamily hydrolase (TIGR01509 family)